MDQDRSAGRRGVVAFAIVGVVVAVVAVVAAAALALSGGGDGDDDREATPVEVEGTTAPGEGTTIDPDVDPDMVIAAAAEAMAAVTGAEFVVTRTGASVFADEFELLQIDGAEGQFAAPSRVQARLDVTVNGTVQTELAAISIDDELWLSNPLTGEFDTLPPGFDIDLSRIFDPEEGWRPLLLNLEGVELIGIVDRGGERYHIRGVSPAAQVENFTVGLIRDQDLPVDFWIDPTTSLVTAVELTAAVTDGDAVWALEMSGFGEEFVIEPPDIGGG